MITLNVLKANLPIKGVLRTKERSDKWDSLEIQFPVDYREFISYFGSGYIESTSSTSSKSISIISPLTEGWYSHYVSYLECLEETEEYLSGEITLHPSPGGCLPFGKAQEGVFLFWITRGTPDQWIIGVHDNTLHGFSTHQMGMVEFINNMIMIPAFCKQIGDCSRSPHFIPDRWY